MELVTTQRTSVLATLAWGFLISVVRAAAAWINDWIFLVYSQSP